MTMRGDYSVLHGLWEADATITTSDRRLKTSIQPLYRTLAGRAKDRWSETRTDRAPADGNKQQEPPTDWLLRELRPVSFKLKSGPEAKYLKFGFIAQELETIFPNLVRNIGAEKGSTEGTKAIASQDLLAVLTLAMQNLQGDMEKDTVWMLEEIHKQRRQLADIISRNRLRMARVERVIFPHRSLGTKLDVSNAEKLLGLIK